MSIHEKLQKRHPVMSNEEWRKNLRRSTIKSILIAAGAYLLSAIFTVWLLWR